MTKKTRFRSPALVCLLLGPAAWGATPPPWLGAAHDSLALLSGQARVPGLHHPVRVARDRWGVAHIRAKDTHDLFFAQGYVAAQDRLFQMEIWKRAGQGRLAEVLGPTAVGRDISARLLRYRGDPEAEYRSYAPDTQQILAAFTDGINAYIGAIAHGRPGLPVEFRIAGVKPEPWKPEDCLNRMAAYSMMSNAARELQHAQAVSILGPEGATPLFRLDPKTDLAPVPGLALEGLTPALLAPVVSADARIPFPAPTGHESNNWVVSGRLTASGRPLLANDPHRVMALPSLRYLVHLQAPGWNVIGAGEPGLPGVAVGHNEEVAWGFTIFGVDQEDLYVETKNPGDPRQYRTAQGWETMREEHEVIRVRGAPDVGAVLHFTAHGPVLWEDGRRALALRWVGAEPGTAGYLASLTLDRVHSWEEFEQAMPRWKVPAENIVYADRHGNIGEHSTGLVPLRRTWNGLLPVPADAMHEWQGFIPNAELPHSHNPAAGFVASANNRMTPADYPHAVGFEWADPVRSQRITEVLSGARDSGHKLTMADMRALQTDVVSLPARRLQPLLKEALGNSAQGTGSPDELRQAAELLLAWDGKVERASAAAALYELWTDELRTTVTRTVVPERARGVMGTLPLARVLDALEGRGGAALEPGGGRLLLAALGSARTRLVSLQGEDPRQWSWGALHHMAFRHALDDIAPGLKWIDPAPVERPGDAETVGVTGYDAHFDQVHGASYREILDLADWDSSLAVNVPGQSGQPKAKHYDDLLPLWAAGGYFPLAFSKGAVDQVSTDVLMLTP